MQKKQRKQLASIIDKFSNEDGIHDTAIPGLKTIRLSDINMHLPTVYDPSLCVIVQGHKKVLLKKEVYEYAPSQYLVVSVDLAVIGQVTQASRDKPYLCLQIDIDPQLIAELMAQQPQTNAETARGIFVGDMDENFADAVLRLTRLLETPQDIPHLVPVIFKEIHYRLLNGGHGATIAQIAINGSNMNRISTAIQSIKRNFHKHMTVENMARDAGMSVSSFHFHFRQVAAMSPLQYQKRLRLNEARRLMIADALDATSTAYRVGYESPTQFSREYARLFGNPPIRDVDMIRSAS